MSPRLRNLFLTTSALLAFGSPGAAGPDGANVVQGTATVQGQGTASVIINQSTDRAVINWNTFNIGTGESTRFNQPSSSSVILNRVTGGLGPSVIDGTLTANGNVFVINPDGMLFGPHAVINTAGFLATTSNIKNKDFMAGRYNFSVPGRPDASIVNQGNITAASGGFAALVAPGVRNSGTITATLGTVALAAGNMFTLDLYGDRLIQLGVGDQIASQVQDVATGRPLTALVSNDGKLKANGGRVELTAAAARRVVDSVINTSGVIEANSVGRKGGMIVIGAATAATKGAGAPRQTVRIAGHISASGKGKNGKGGTVVVTGEDILLEGARITATGRAGGGKVLIGGDWGGGTPTASLGNASAKLEGFAIPTASTLSVDAASTINTSATAHGDGGKVVLWSDMQTTFAGTIFAQGGARSGDGGFVETSSHGVLAFTGTANTLAPNGKTGTLLLDPFDVTIGDTGAVAIGPVFTAAEISFINATALGNLLNANSIVISTGGLGPALGGNITVAAPITWASNSSLTLNANRDIAINAAITANNGGALNLNAGNAVTATGAVDVTRFALRGGDWSQVSDVLPKFAAQDFQISLGASFLRALGGNGSAATPYRLADVYGLQGVGSSLPLLGKNYVLANNIDANVTLTWNTGIGFKPIGTDDTPFTGNFNGAGHTIDGLRFAGTSGNFVGLFGVNSPTGTIHDVGVTNVSINFSESLQHAGALVGKNAGTVERTFATGSVTAGPDSAEFAGLVGVNTATGLISQSFANVAVSGGARANEFGGLVGENNGGGAIFGVNNSYSTGSVTGDQDSRFFGGLVGENDGGTIRHSYSTGLVTGAPTSTFVGGLVGVNSHPDVSNPGPIIFTNPGTVVDSYWDTERSQQPSSAGGAGAIGLPTSQMQNLASFAGFDFQTVWAPPNVGSQLNGGAHYPELYALSHVIWAKANDATRFYGSDNPPFSAAIFGKRPDDANLTVNGLTLSTLADQTTNVGNATITIGGASLLSNDGSLYRFVYTPGTLAITPRPISIAANGQTRPYGNDNPPLTFTVGGLGLANNDVLGGGLSTGATNQSNGGQYAITLGSLGAANTNYNITGFTGAQIDVTPRPISIAANGQTRPYGNDNPPLTFTVGGLGLANNDVLGGGLSTGATNQSNVGQYAITLGSLGAANTNYNITGFTGAQIDVTPRPISITANRQTRPYGNDNLPLTFTVGGLGLANNDVLGGGLSTTATNQSIVGQYAITLGSLGAANTNYNITGFTGAQIDVTPRPISIAANGQTRPYGNDNVPLTFTVGGLGLANNDVLGGGLSTGATNQSNVGQYAITLGSLGTANTNYNITGFTGAQVNVTPRPLTITANDATKTEGQALTFAGTEFKVSGGLVNNDSVTSVTLTSTGAVATAATVNSPFPIVPSNAVGAGVANYAIEFVNGTLTVTSNPVLPPPLGQVAQGGNPPPSPPTPGPNVVNTQGLNLLPPPPPPPSGANQPPQPNAPPPPNSNNNTAGATPPTPFIENRFFIPPAIGETDVAQNELVLHISSSVSREALEAAAAQAGFTILESYSLGSFGTFAVRLLTNNLPIAEAMNLVSQWGIASAATGNYIYKLAQDPAARTSETTQGDAGQYILGKLRLSDVHRGGRGNNISIAVVDSEIDGAHPDLEGVIVNRFDATGTADPPHAHGTGMAGAIASHRRLLGIAPGAHIIAIRAFSSQATSAESTTFNILRGIDYAINSGVRIINMSFAGPRDPTLERALKVAHSKGVVLIAAAGNAGPKSPPLYPAADPNVIAVTATDIDDKLFTGANRGRHIAIAAPGVEILVPAPERSYQLTTGTSVATAHISGIVALLLERNPKLTPDDIRRILTASARRLGPNDEFGAGLVDPAKALRLADPRAVNITGSVPPRPVAIPGSVPARPAASPGSVPARPAAVPGSVPARPVR